MLAYYVAICYNLQCDNVIACTGLAVLHDHLTIKTYTYVLPMLQCESTIVQYSNIQQLCMPAHMITNKQFRLKSLKVAQKQQIKIFLTWKCNEESKNKRETAILRKELLGDIMKQKPLRKLQSTIIGMELLTLHYQERMCPTMSLGHCHFLSPF